MFRSGNGNSSQTSRNNSGHPLYPVPQPYSEMEQEEDVTDFDYTSMMRDDGRFDLPDLPLPNRPFVLSDQRSNSNNYLSMNDDLPLMPHGNYLSMNDDLPLMPHGPESRSYSLDSYPVPPPRRAYPPSLSIPPPVPPPHSMDTFNDGNPLTPPMHHMTISMPEPHPFQPDGGSSYTPFNTSPTAAHYSPTGFLSPDNSPQPPPHAVPTQQGSFASIPGSYGSNPNSPNWRKLPPPSPTNGYPPPQMLGESSAQSSQGSLDMPTINRGPHYGLAPKRQLRRYRTKRKIQLRNGHLVLDCPAPTKLLQSCQLRDHHEFTHMRYTAATCDPDDFMKDNYDLRQQIYGRKTELFIVVTMYNEDEVLFTRTMHGVMKNIAHLVSRKKSRTWGDDGWKKVVVCIVADGRKKCNQRVLSVLAGMGVYQDGIAKNIVNGKEVTAHIYEYTSQVSIEPDNLKIKGSDKGIVPCQILFCMKERNQKKLNSHRWFFNAFAPILRPNICVLLDVGTRPGNTSIYHLWKAFDVNPNIGGACGEIRAMTGISLFNPLVAAQNFEYKMSNILDKPLESVFGYISVLPGAFSAYRFAALTPDRLGNGPLTQYFKGENQHGSETDVFTANMYLAEDRILCYELVSKKNEAWVLHYVKSAFGETDVPDAVPEFISQRRRWLNGSFFAAIYSLYHFHNIWRSNHTFWRKISLHIEFLYNFISLLFSWLAMGNFYISFYYIAKSLADPTIDPFMGHGELIFDILRYLYYFLIIVQFILSMGNRPQGSKWPFTLSMIFFAIIMGYMLFAAGFLTYQTVLFASTKIDDPDADSVVAILFKIPGFRDIIVSLAGTYGLYFIVSFMYLDPWHMGTSFIQYMFLLPSYINTLNIYAFCNTHDVSWGTKGDTAISTDLGVAKSTGSNKGVETVEVELPTEEVDINEAYEEALSDMRKKMEKKHQKRDAKTKQEDYYRSFRTQLVLWWIACNAMLIAIVTAQEFQNIFLSQATGANLYLSVIMWTVAGLALFRFIGSSLYLLIRFLTDG